MVVGMVRGPLLVEGETLWSGYCRHAARRQGPERRRGAPGGPVRSSGRAEAGGPGMTTDDTSQDFVRAGALADLERQGRLVLRGRHRPVLVLHDCGRVT